MATHSSVLAWEAPWTEKPGGLHTVPGVAKQSDTIEFLTTTKLLLYLNHWFGHVSSWETPKEIFLVSGHYINTL